jgi:integrase
MARDQYLIDTYILPAFGNRQLKSIQPLEVRTWIAGLAAKGLAPATVRKAAQLFSADLEAACNDGLIPRNPARRVDLPKIEKVEMRFLTPDEVRSLAGAIDPRYSCLVFTAAYTGLRFGELAALKVSRLDMLRRTIRVEETLSEVSGHLAFGPPKTAAARRTVTLPKTLVEVLAAHLAKYPVGEEGLIFTAPAAGPLRATQFRNRVWYAAVAASVGTPCRFHDLRHTAAALLIREKVHPKVIQQRLGHASIRTTLDVHGHVFEGLDEAAAEALDRTLGERAVGLAWG